MSSLFEIEPIEVDLLEIELFQLDFFTIGFFGTSDSIRKGKSIILYGQSCLIV